MADLSETLLSLAGWLVAGAVTLIGILVTSWIQDRRRQYNRDLVEVYEPTYAIVKEDHDTEEFKLCRPEVPCSWDCGYRLRDLLKSGKLIPGRFRDFRSDLNELSRLAAEAERIEKSLVDLTKAKLKEEVDLLRQDGAVMKSLNQTLLNAIEEGLLFPLLKSRMDEASTTIEGTKKDPRIIGDKELFGTKAIEIYASVDAEIAAARREYHDKAVQYFDLLGSVEQSISDSIDRNGSPYKRTMTKLQVKKKLETGAAPITQLDDQDIRRRILRFLYDVHQRDPSAEVDSLTTLSDELGLDRTIVLRNAKYLADKGLIKVTWMVGKNFFRGASISAVGIDEIEAKNKHVDAVEP